MVLAVSTTNPRIWEHDLYSNLLVELQKKGMGVRICPEPLMDYSQEQEDLILSLIGEADVVFHQPYAFAEVQEYLFRRDLLMNANVYPVGSSGELEVQKKRKNFEVDSCFLQTRLEQEILKKHKSETLVDADVFLANSGEVYEILLRNEIPVISRCSVEQWEFLLLIHRNNLLNSVCLQIRI
jgi:hypothetical protein